MVYLFLKVSDLILDTYHSPGDSRIANISYGQGKSHHLISRTIEGVVHEPKDGKILGLHCPIPQTMLAKCLLNGLVPTLVLEAIDFLGWEGHHYVLTLGISEFVLNDKEHSQQVDVGIFSQPLVGQPVPKSVQ